MHTILIVDDEKHTRDGLLLSLEESFDVYTASSISSALEILENDNIEVLLTDLRLGEEDGMELIHKAISIKNPPISIMMTAYGSVNIAVKAMQMGAYDFVTKPINIDNLEILIKRAIKNKNLESEVKNLKQKISGRKNFGKLIGKSTEIEKIYKLIDTIAPTNSTILIEGESGTGKEIISQTIHDKSLRKNSKLVVVNCSAIPAQLLESELFGHEKGAFTHAISKRIGRFEEASGGTLMLDEIGEIDHQTQVKLLRVLGEKTFERVGGNKSIKADVRIIAATNKNLEKLVKEGKFREDLFFRLNVIRLEVPPLRNRQEDIPLLARSFLKELSKENNKSIKNFDNTVLGIFMKYNWKGNVRELRSVIEHCVVMCQENVITKEHLPPFLTSLNFSEHEELTNSKIFNLKEIEKISIKKALTKANNNKTETAKLLGIARKTLFRKLKEMEE